MILPRESAGLQLLQQIRDEAHRFALRGHRTRRAAGQTASLLDTLPGVGQRAPQRAVAHFGDVGRLLEASRSELEAVPGLPAAVGRTIYDHLHRVGGARGVTAAGHAADRVVDAMAATTLSTRLTQVTYGVGGWGTGELVLRGERPVLPRPAVAGRAPSSMRHIDADELAGRSGRQDAAERYVKAFARYLCGRRVQLRRRRRSGSTRRATSSG